MCKSSGSFYELNLKETVYSAECMTLRFCSNVEFEWEARVRSAVCFGPTFVYTRKCHAVSRSYGARPAAYLQLNDTSGVAFRND